MLPRPHSFALLALLATPAVAQDGDLDDIFDDLVDPDELSDDGLDELLGGAEVDGVPDLGGSSSVLTEWKGFLEVSGRTYLDDRGRGRNDEQLLLEGELELSFRFDDDLTGYLRPRVFVDALDGELSRFEPYEAYLTLEGDAWDLRAGQFVENWGIVDTFNPIDVVSRRDFGTDFLDPDRLGELGVRYRLLGEGGTTVGEPTLSLYGLPVWRATPFPPRDQRFAFDTPTVAFVEESGFEPSGSEGVLVAARLNGTLTTGPANADVQLLAARGPERTPVVVPQGPSAAIPVYFGATTVGLGFRAVPNRDALGAFLATLTLKAEVARKSPYAFDGSPVVDPDDYTAYVLGVDREFYDVIAAQDSLTTTVEYARENGASDATATFRPFRDDVILRALWQQNDFARTSVEARGIYDLDTDEVIAEAIFERQLRSIHEDLKLTVQLQLFDPPGTGASLFDFFPDNSSVRVGLRWDL